MNNIIELKKILSTDEREILRSEIDRKKKSTGIAYILWFLTNWIGLHKFYLGKPLQGFLFLIGPAISLFFLIGGISASIQKLKGPDAGAAIFIGLFGLAVWGTWWIVDLFTLHKQTERANEKIEEKLILQIRREQ